MLLLDYNIIYLFKKYQFRSLLTEENRHKKRKFLFNPLKRPLPYVGLLIAIVLFLFQQTIRNYVADTMGNMLIKSMKEASGGLYKTTYDLVRFDIIAKELRIINLQIELDSNVISKEEYLHIKPNLIHVNTPIVVLKLRSLLPLLFKDQLYVSYIGAQNPQFSLLKSEHKSIGKNETENSREDFRKTINTYFSAFEIDSFRIEKGSFRITTHTENETELDLIHIGEFTTMLKNFRLDSLSPSILLKGMRAQSFDLEIIDQDVNILSLNQNIHFNRLSLSTVDSTFILDSLKIKNISQGNSINQSDLAINKLEILGFNFDKAFFKNELLINEIRIDKPSIAFTKNDYSIKTKDSTSVDNSLFEYFNDLKINRINIFNGSLDFEGKRKSKIGNLTISVEDYIINTNDWKKRKPFSDFKILLINANEIQQELPDSIHVAKIDQIIYTGSNNRAIASKIRISPISGRNSYKILKSRNSNLSMYSNLNAVTVTGFFPETLIKTRKFSIDSLVINKPSTSIVQYPGIRIKSSNASSKRNEIKFDINHLITNNGSLKLRKYQNKINQLTSLNGVYFSTSRITEKILVKDLPDNFKILISNGSTELKNIGHTATFSNISVNDKKLLSIERLNIKPDSTSLLFNQIDAKLQDVLIEGVDIESMTTQSISLDTVIIGKIDLAADFSRTPFEKSKSNNKKKLESIDINAFRIKNSTITIHQKETISYIEKAEISIQNIHLDSMQNGSNPSINFSNTLLNATQFKFENIKDSIKIEGRTGYYSESDSTFNVTDLQFSSPSPSLKINLDEVNVSGFNKDELLTKGHFKITKLELLKPTLILSEVSMSDSLSAPLDINSTFLKGSLNKVSIDTINLYKGKSTVSISKDKTLGISNFEGIITDVSIDSLTTYFDSIDKFKGVFELSDIYLKGLNDTLLIEKLHFDSDHKFLWTDSIHFTTLVPNNHLKFASPGIAIDHIDIPKLLEKKIKLGQVATRNNLIILTQTDTLASTNDKKIKIPFDLSVFDLNIVNTTFEYNKFSQPNHLLANLNFDIELDSLKFNEGHLFDLAKQTKDARFRSYNFSFNLPDSLNTVRFDTLLVSSGTSSIDISNLTLKARYPKYEYGNQVGHQVDWKDLLVENIKVENIDFVELIEKGALNCQKITINEGYLDLFKDKQLPYPADRVIPMLQNRFKNIKTPIKIDTIKINSIDIFQTTLQSTGLQEGGISFINTSGIITNISNDSLRLANNRMMDVSASTKIMGSGNLTANFHFDMLDDNNIFFFDARLGKMDAKAFNNILEATAHVSVKSGEVKSLNLEATGNKSYAYGNMSFIYNNLKVETLNKKTLEHKGMGKVLKTFFANAFVVKKNNSRIKLLGRRGEMYYERDISRITLDYAAKTALSGIVSSIGAKNNRKAIKQIQKENKAARDLELKQQKEIKKSVNKKNRE